MLGHQGRHRGDTNSCRRRTFFANDTERYRAKRVGKQCRTKRSTRARGRAASKCARRGRALLAPASCAGTTADSTNAWSASPTPVLYEKLDQIPEPDGLARATLPPCLSKSWSTAIQDAAKAHRRVRPGRTSSCSKHARTRTDEPLGVTRMDRARREHHRSVAPKASALRPTETARAFFDATRTAFSSRTSKRVQGDDATQSCCRRLREERNGRLPHFGPASSGGERSLNVAITRAPP